MWGFTGILGKLIHLEASVIVWYRVVIAFIALGVYMSIRGWSFKVSSRKRLLQILVVGMFVGVHWLTFYQSIQLSTASLGILCLSTTTLHVAWLEPLVMKKKFSKLEMFLSIVVVVGIYIATDNFSPKEYEALGYGLISAFFAALFAVFNTKLVETDSASIISFYELVAASITLSFVLLFNGQLNNDLFVMTGEDFFWLLFLALACTSFAFIATIIVMDKLGTFTVSLSINLEPIYTLILAVFILQENEELNSRFYLGAVIIILTVLADAVIKNISNTREKRKPSFNSKHVK